MNSQVGLQSQQSLPATLKQANIETSIASFKIKDSSIKLESNKDRLNLNNDSQTYTKKQVRDFTKKLNEAIGPLNTFVQFGVDKHNIFYIAVIDKQTGKILSRFPAAQAPYVLQKIKEPIGIIFDTKG